MATYMPSVLTGQHLDTYMVGLAARMILVNEAALGHGPRRVRLRGRVAVPSTPEKQLLELQVLKLESKKGGPNIRIPTKDAQRLLSLKLSSKLM